MGRNQTRSRLTLRFFGIISSFTAAVFFTAASLGAEPLRIAYTSIAMVYGPLWLTKEAGVFKKHNIDPELLYIAGGPPSLQALIAGDVAVSFTAAGAAVAANLSGSDLVRTNLRNLRDQIFQARPRSDANGHPDDPRRDLRYPCASLWGDAAALRRISVHSRTRLQRLRRGSVQGTLVPLFLGRRKNPSCRKSAKSTSRTTPAGPAS